MAKQPSLLSRIRNNVASAIAPNSMQIPLFNRGDYRKHIETGEFDNLFLKKEDKYKAYLYAIIRTKANRLASLATDNTVKTRLSTDDDTDDIDPHPYLALIDNSPTFTTTQFWRANSTWLDLTGNFYILAIRNYDENRKGEIVEMKLLNPFNLKPVKNKDGEIGGYIETNELGQRTLPYEMVICGKLFNPFDTRKGYPMVDAAIDSHFLGLEAGQYTRKSIKKNVGQRGIITTDVILEDKDFANFKSRLAQTDIGDFLVGNGAGSIAYQDTQIDLDKLALESVKDMSREELFAVTGGSKTILGIEQSGVTRETSKTQRELMDQNHVIPQMQDILDALNQDYRNSYPNEYQKTPIELYVDSPYKVDTESDLKEAQINKAKAEAAKTLVDAGYDPEAALKVVDLDEEMGFVGTPIRNPQPADATNARNKIKIKVPSTKATESKHEHAEDEADLVINEFNQKLQTIALGKQTSLENDIVNIERKMVSSALAHIDKNDITQGQKDEVLSKSDQTKYTKELYASVAIFYASMIELFGSMFMRDQIKEQGMVGQFDPTTPSIKATIKRSATKAAESHVATVMEDIYNAAQEAAKAGGGRTEITKQLTQTYGEKISKVRARTIARTESNRSVNSAQFESDKQFLDQNGLNAKGYKKWRVRSSRPCPFCASLDGTEVPFDANFANLGDEINVEGKNDKGETVHHTYFVGYEDVGSGTLHPNCNCVYELIIRT